MRYSFFAVSWLGVLWATSLPVGCAHEARIVLEDPAGDDNGPGSYRYPDNPAFGAGSFDLRRFSLTREKDYWVVSVAFAARVKRSPVFVSRDDRRDLFMQTVDVYLRSAKASPAEGEDHLDSLPGRGVMFAPGQAWNRALVLSPVPGLLREALDKTFPGAGDVFVPRKVRISGHRLVARVPVSFLGQSRPEAISVLVSATRFSLSFDLIDRARGRLAPEGLVMTVEKSAGECRLDDAGGMACHFSGCDPCGGHPNVIDLLAPAGVQTDLLSRYNPDTGEPARLPLIAVGPPDKE
ncbi:MAG TPA: glucodextranase DOMON-like domain-containing protein [Myxococcota bacterium]|nr:glucodextranase DOMON-like domain-containing protein [Myxococcota bacterium]